MSVGWVKRNLGLRTLALVVFYACLLSLSYFLAYELRFDFNIGRFPEHAADRIDTLWWVVLLKLVLLFAFGQMDCILSYFRLPDAMRLFAALFLASVLLAVMWFVYEGQEVPPRAVIVTDLLLGFVFIAGFRVAMRVKSSRGLADWFAGKDARNVLIAGAGEVGASLCVDLLQKSRLGMRPVAFLDDDPSKIGRFVHGVLVVDEVDALPRVAKRYAVTKVIIAFPSASVARVREVAELARASSLEVDIVPALTDLVSGRAEMTQLRPVQLEDLLGRDPVDLNSDKIRAMLEGKRIVVTGAGGSIGRELVWQILSYAPARLICVDHSEGAVFELQQMLRESHQKLEPVETRVLDIGGREAAARLFRETVPDVVFHAAAHKHVSLMESQPAQAVKNNFFATTRLVQAAGEASVERFILVSTDKAINPTSVMGATKRLAELALLRQQAAPGNTTKFMAVRFGNVLGSSGSVIPIFRRQIAAGGPVTVTHPEVNRFFMTADEAVGLVLQSGTLGRGGEIFVLDMGDPVKILDVAKQMIALSGYREGEDIEIRFTGLKPGEKLFEEVRHLSERLYPTEHPRVLRFVSGESNALDEARLVELGEAVEAGDAVRIKKVMLAVIPEYSPYWEASGPEEQAPDSAPQAG